MSQEVPMRAVQAKEYGGPDVLQVVEVPAPEVAPGRVLVRVSAATVNPADWFTRTGVLAAMTPGLEPPLVLGWDLAGVVEVAGGGFEAGQRVVGMVPWFDERTGTYAELVAADPAWLAPLPAGVSDVVGAALPLNGLTASQAVDLVGLTAGQTLLVTGASGAVGGYAVQLASAAGLRVLAVGSGGDEAHLRGLGAEQLLERAGPDELVAAVRSAVPGGVDGVLDAAPVGPTLIGAVRDGGVFITVLDPAVPAPERGIRADKVSVVPDPAGLRRLVAAQAAGTLTTRVADTMALAQAGAAQERAAAGGLRGKIVLTV